MDILISKRGYSLADVRRLTPIERELYIGFAHEEAEKAQKRSKPQEMIMGTPIDTL